MISPDSNNSFQVEYEEAGPRASAMIESLRAFGYDLPTALADLIDNSITAGARRIWLNFYWNGPQSAIVLRDDGHGMNEEELVAAMRLGSRSPLEERKPNDLGRFGLGLKTASFSHCRLLTVRSRRVKGTPVTRCWDLDYVVQSDAWRLLREAPEGAEEYLAALDVTESGTVVLWQQLDRLVDDSLSTNETAQNHFYSSVDEVKQHLSMVFHDYLCGRGAIQMTINSHPVQPWDPFLTGANATQKLPEQTIYWNGNEVITSPYVLPHHSRLNSSEWEAAAGPRGWNAGQGFYIYRNRRLLVAGDWLGMGFGKEEHFKLARIRLDLPNSSDADWHLDVKKSRAWPPAPLRERLRHIAIATRRCASEVYRHRGARLLPKPGAEKLHLWEAKKRRGKVFYALNYEHPLVKSVLESSTDSASVRALLRLVQETLPVPLIAVNNAENPRDHALPFEHTPSPQVRAVMRQIYSALLDSGHSALQARGKLAQMDAFERFPELIATIDDFLDEEILPENGDESS